MSIVEQKLCTMRPRWLFPLILAAFWPWPSQIHAGQPAPARRYAQLEQMDTQARVAWVETMLKRLDKANGVVLAPAAIAKQHSRFESMLVAFVENRAHWQEQVVRFEAELALGQRAAIEHLTRQYRIESYHTFRGDYRGYERRRVHLERLLAGWRESGARSDEQHKVVNWLLAASRGSTDPGGDRLPPLPHVEGHRQARPTERSIARSNPSPSEPQRSELPALKPSASAVLPEVEPALPPALSDATVPLSGPRPSGVLTGRAVAATGSEVLRPPVLYTPPAVELPLAVHRSTPRPHHVAMLPSFKSFRFTAPPEPAAIASSLRIPWRQPPSMAGVTRRISRPQPQIAGVATPVSPHQAADPLAFARTKVDRLTMASSRGRLIPANNAAILQAMQTGKTTSMPTAFTPTGDGSSRSSHSHQTTRPTARLARSGSASFGRDAAAPADSTRRALPSQSPGQSRRLSPTKNPTEVKINLDELASRIKGNNRAMRRLAARLVQNDDWDAKSLGSVLDELAPLVARKDDLKLIRECISPKLQDRLGKLESGSDLISDLGSKIARARSQVEKGKFQGTPAERKAELKQLGRLSRRLTALVFNNQ